jgi:hypothetical protein
MPVINGRDITWEDLDAFAFTKLSFEELKKYQAADKKDSQKMVQLTDGYSQLFDKERHSKS